MNTPHNPAGELPTLPGYDESLREELTEALRLVPGKLSATVDGLTDEQLDTTYRNWTIRQIVHHIADSHVHSYIRFKWTLTEETPTIKAYEEAEWVERPDSKSGAIQPALGLLQGIHLKWVQVLESMGSEEFEQSFVHPQSGEIVTLWTALNYYPWHARHHTAQIQWLKDEHHWA